MSHNRFLLAVIVLVTAAFIHARAESEEKQIFGDIYPDSLSFSLINKQSKGPEYKCQREVPALFFQTSKNEPIRGNGSTIYFHRLEVCCDGYTRSAYDFSKCIPDCSAVSPNNCRNGFCRAPQQCTCFDEFVRNDRGECVHTCPIACEHGRCYLNGTCACDRGYALDPRTSKFCRAVCPQGCATHSRCIAPGICECEEGYKMTEDLGCQPVCIPDCGHGKCVGPNMCKCFEGYIKRPQRKVCEASCYITCENGFCESRYSCQCREGYKYDANTTSCLPDCGQLCQNGVCIAPGVCRCFEGYQLQDGECVPICLGGCGFYGKCIEPQICGCGLSERVCIFGECNILGQCRCPLGLTRFISHCADPLKLNLLVSSYDQREYFDQQLRREFYGLIGQYFQYT